MARISPAVATAARRIRLDPAPPRGSPPPADMERQRMERAAMLRMWEKMKKKEEAKKQKKARKDAKKAKKDAKKNKKDKKDKKDTNGN